MGYRIQVTDRLALDPNLSSAQVETISDQTVGGSLKFTEGVVSTIANKTIAGGQLGENGWVEISALGSFAVTATAGLSATLSVNSTSVTASLPSFAASATISNFEILGLVQNINTEANQMVSLTILAAPFDGSDNRQTKFNFPSSAEDTSIDWVFGLSILSGTGAGQNSIYTSRFSGQYVPIS